MAGIDIHNSNAIRYKNKVERGLNKNIKQPSLCSAMGHSPKPRIEIRKHGTNTVFVLCTNVYIKINVSQECKHVCIYQTNGISLS